MLYSKDKIMSRQSDQMLENEEKDPANWTTLKCADCGDYVKIMKRYIPDDRIVWCDDHHPNRDN